MNLLLASTATLASLAAAAVLAPTQATAAVAPAPASAEATCDRVNHRGVDGTSIDLWGCLGLPGANGRVGYIASISNAWAGEVVTIRYRGVNSELARATAATTGGYAQTAYFWGNPNELEACAYTLNFGFNCAWTADDGNA
jgi:hypothetical protein